MLVLIAILVALLLPAVAATMASGRAFKCQVNQRNVGFAFTIFADDTMLPDRGNDAGATFTLETFQESQYCIDEFWCWEDKILYVRDGNDRNDPMRCPEIRGDVELRRNAPCSGGGVGPPQRVSFGFNVRFHLTETLAPSGHVQRGVARLSTSSFTHPGDTPLFWDVDGERAMANGVQPFYSGPTLDSRILFGERYWFPGLRHNGTGNFGFADGHVDTSRRPLAEGSWQWGIWAGR